MSTLLLITGAAAVVFAIFRHLHQPIITTHARFFDGRSSVVNVDGCSLLDLENCFTLEANFKIPVEQSTRRYTPCIVSKGKGAFNTDHNYYLGIVNKDRRIQFHIGDGAGNYQELISKARVPAERWPHVAAVRSRGTLQIFIDGKPDACVKRILNQKANDAPLKIGATEETHSLHHLAAEIDKVRIWNRAIQQEELRASQSSESSRRHKGLVLRSVGAAVPTPKRNDSLETKRHQSNATGDTWSPPFNCTQYCESFTSQSHCQSQISRD